MKSLKQGKLSIAALQEKAGKAFIDVNAIKGGNLGSCHVLDIDPPITKTDAV